jgi:microcystin-dependent protein
MEGYIAQIIMFGGNFAPRNWAFCNGQLLSIAQNTALFSLLGTTYGGNGQTTFGLPDLRGRVAISPGQGPGLSSYSLGQAAGTESTTLTVANMPAHNHGVTLKAEAAAGTSANPTNNLLAVSVNQDRIYAASDPNVEIAMHPDSIAQNNVGGNQPFNNVQPYLAINYIICLFGIFPSRN